MASSKGKEVTPACSGRSSSGPVRRPAGGFMADARRRQPRSPPPARSTEAPQGRAQVVPLVDAEGFRLVVSKRHLREGRPPPRQQPTRRPIPVDLVGRCFNCLAFYHVAACCTFPSRCLHCESEGHSARQCKRQRPVVAHRDRGRPVRHPAGGFMADSRRQQPRSPLQPDLQKLRRVVLRSFPWSMLRDFGWS